MTNAATSTALNDVLKGSFSGATGAFTASGNLGSGLAAGATDSSSLFTASLNTANAGNFNGNGHSQLQEPATPDMADLNLGDVNITLKAQVNNYANPVFNFGFRKSKGKALIQTTYSGGGLITLFI